LSLDLKNLTPETANLIGLLFADLLDGDIDNEETKTQLRELGKLGVTLARTALRTKGILWDVIAGPLVEKAITDAVEKFIKDKSAK